MPFITEGSKKATKASTSLMGDDIGMPETDGYELIRQVRSRDAKIPAIAVTAFARSEDRIRAFRAGFNMHIAKPLEPQELITVISALVRGRSAG